MHMTDSILQNLSVPLLLNKNCTVLSILYTCKREGHNNSKEKYFTLVNI